MNLSGETVNTFCVGKSLSEYGRHIEDWNGMISQVMKKERWMVGRGVFRKRFPIVVFLLV
jgi:hypothetical protein